MNQAADYGPIMRALVKGTIARCPPPIIADELFARFERALDAVARAVADG
ncbi:MAG: hypothetical protein IT563_16600 [Alphaproteobacteria bacterium]|nr:hypothetical protein [Alphaproteobacteria bacterium]